MNDRFDRVDVEALQQRELPERDDTRELLDQLGECW